MGELSNEDKMRIPSLREYRFVTKAKKVTYVTERETNALQL